MVMEQTELLGAIQWHFLAHQVTKEGTKLLSGHNPEKSEEDFEGSKCLDFMLHVTI